MRSNLPVTNVEYVLKDGEAPTSRTDIHGNITYVNRDFVRISGFTEEELLGQPQNLVRHPDMPREAFTDLWRTIRGGKPWTGFVKNRCKNGDYYWVEANVSPIVNNGQIVGYTSVRAKPGREQVQAAEAAYRAIREGDTTLEVHEGKALKRTLFSRLLGRRALPLKALMGIASSSMALIFTAIGMLAWFATVETNRVLTGWLMSIAALGLPMAAAFAVIAYRSVVAPIASAREEIDRMAMGDMTGRFEAHGVSELAELMQSLRVLQVNTRWLIGQIKEATDVVQGSAVEIASGSLDLSTRTESQASSLEETASSLEQITGTVKQNAENAHHARGLVSSTAEIAVQGGEVVGQVITTMASIKQSSKKIADIIGVIDGIAFQTNILALNAAVEAARAGEQGRGFAVVATEVRNLAQRSATAAKEIKTLIEDSVSKVDAGGTLVDEAGKTMDEIVASVKRVTDIMSEIAAASGEQSSGIDQINQAVGQMDDLTQQNAALVEEEAAAAESLQNEAAKLSQLVASFRLVRGAQTAAVAMDVGSRPAAGARVVQAAPMKKVA